MSCNVELRLHCLAVSSVRWCTLLCCPARMAELSPTTSTRHCAPEVLGQDCRRMLTCVSRSVENARLHAWPRRPQSFDVGMFVCCDVRLCEESSLVQVSPPENVLLQMQRWRISSKAPLLFFFWNNMKNHSSMQWVESCHRRMEVYSGSSQGKRLVRWLWNSIKRTAPSYPTYSNFKMTGSGKGKGGTWAPWNWYSTDALKAFYDV